MATSSVKSLLGAKIDHSGILNIKRIIYTIRLYFRVIFKSSIAEIMSFSASRYKRSNEDPSIQRWQLSANPNKMAALPPSRQTHRTPGPRRGGGQLPHRYRVQMEASQGRGRLSTGELRAGAATGGPQHLEEARGGPRSGRVP